ncbi:hypothetical protein HanIR_Chr12g0575391 [Helianthus annuus]|nr:hypothetical protein HanIR_Chr12g0575391 [Helianthus annuus]
MKFLHRHHPSPRPPPAPTCLHGHHSHHLFSSCKISFESLDFMSVCFFGIKLSVLAVFVFMPLAASVQFYVLMFILLLFAPQRSLMKIIIKIKKIKQINHKLYMNIFETVLL